MKIGRRQLSGFLVLGVMLAAPVAQTAGADAGTAYLKVDVGPSWVSDIKIKEVNGNFFDQGQEPKFKLNTGVRADLAFGINLSRVFALELETALLYNSFNSKVTSSGTISPAPADYALYQIPVMLNGVFTLLPDSKFHPFLGGGLGGICSFTPSVVDSDSFSGAFQFMAGAKYDLAQNVDVGLSYRFLGSLRQTLLRDVTADYIYTHSIVAALTVHF